MAQILVLKLSFFRFILREFLGIYLLTAHYASWHVGQQRRSSTLVDSGLFFGHLPHVRFIDLISSSTVRRQVVMGRPLFLLHTFRCPVKFLGAKGYLVPVNQAQTKSHQQRSKDITHLEYITRVLKRNNLIISWHHWSWWQIMKLLNSKENTTFDRKLDNILNWFVLFVSYRTDAL